MSEEIQFTDEIVYNGGINEADAPSKIKDNQWVSGSNAEPLPDGVRMRRGFTNENSVPIPAIDASHEAGTDTRTFTGTTELIAQSFTIAANAEIIAVEVRLKKDSGTPTASTFVNIMSDDGAGPPSAPSAVITNLGSTDFTQVAAATLTSDFKWYRFTIVDYANVVTLTAGTKYWLIVGHINVTTPNTAIIEEVTTPSGYANGNVATSPDIFSWTDVPAADLNFRVLTGTAIVTGIQDYSLSDAATEYHMVFAGQHLYKNVAGTFTPVSQLPRVNEYVANADTHPSMLVANDRLMLTDGTDPGQQFYVKSAVEYYENVGISAPTTVPTLTPTAGSALSPDGVWEIDYYYFNSRTGQSSRRKYDGVAVPDTTTSTQHIVITGLPATTARTNDVATSLRFEAKAPSGSVFRTVADANGVPIDVAIGTTTVTINSSNTFTTLAEYDDNLPPQHSFGIIAENRHFIGGETASPWRIRWSKISGGVPYYESFPSTHFRDFGRGDGDYNTAFAFMSPRTLVVGFKNSIWAIDARDPGVSDRFRIAKGIGIANHKSLIVQGNTIYFVSDADEQKGMFKWQPGMEEPKLLTGIDNTFGALVKSRLDNCSCVYFAPDENRHQWWTTLSGAAQTAQTKVLVYDTKLDAWTDYNIAANVLGLVEEASAIEVFLGQTGYEAKADNGTTDNGAVITAMFQTKDYTFGLFGVRKKSRFIDYVALRKAAGSLSVSLIVDAGSEQGGTANLSFPSLGAAFVLGTSQLGSTAVLGGGEGDSSGRAAVRALGRLIAYEYSSQTDFHLKTVSYGIQSTGRR